MYYRWEQGALILNCSIKPSAKRDGFDGLIGERLKIRVAATPTGGKANRQLIRFLAKEFGTKQSAVTVVSGQASRHKRLRIEKPFTIPGELEIAEERTP